MVTQGAGYIVRALLVASGNPLPAWLLLPNDQEATGRGSRLAMLKPRASKDLPGAPKMAKSASLLLERQHEAFVAAEDGDATGQVTSLTIAENPLTSKGIEDILNLFNPQIGEHQAA